MLKIMDRQLLQISSKACISQNYANNYELAIAPDLQQKPQQTTKLKTYEQAIAPDLKQNPQPTTTLKIMNRQLLQISSKVCSRQN
jgi:hypothetical protein